MIWQRQLGDETGIIQVLGIGVFYIRSSAVIIITCHFIATRKANADGTNIYWSLVYFPIVDFVTIMFCNFEDNRLKSVLFCIHHCPFASPHMPQNIALNHVTDRKFDNPDSEYWFSEDFERFVWKWLTQLVLQRYVLCEMTGFLCVNDLLCIYKKVNPINLDVCMGMISHFIDTSLFDVIAHPYRKCNRVLTKYFTQGRMPLCHAWERTSHILCGYNTASILNSMFKSVVIKKGRTSWWWWGLWEVSMLPINFRCRLVLAKNNFIKLWRAQNFLLCPGSGSKFYIFIFYIHAIYCLWGKQVGVCLQFLAIEYRLTLAMIFMEEIQIKMQPFALNKLYAHLFKE